MRKTVWYSIVMVSCVVIRSHIGRQEVERVGSTFPRDRNIYLKVGRQ